MAKGKVSQSEMIWMTVIAILIPSILLIGALVYVAFYAGGFSLFQKLVIALIALIIVCVAESILWMIWAGKKGLMNWPQSKQSDWK